MSKIILGKEIPGGKNVGIDIPELLTTRLLVQANSGGGKSWLLRRMAEQLYGKVQTIIIDPEGEFLTLRDKFGYVLVGEGGETPADVRSAALLAQKFMELKISAVCDLFEAFRSRPTERRRWVRDFLNALLEVPRSLWNPLIVIIDEAHKFCPQETPKAGSMTEREIISGCKDAMIALSTTGRKRGFCPVWATQRLAKLDKDASAELFNRLVGMTIEDVDVDRAADLMSVSKEDKHDFRTSLRTLDPGQFYAFGRAISKVRILLKSGDIQTRHPESGAAAKYSAPPPMPEAVAKLLPKLADLPKEAEDKARSEQELKREIRELKAQLSAISRQPSAKPAAGAAKADPRVIERQVASAVKSRDGAWSRTLRDFQREVERRVSEASKQLSGQLHSIPLALPEELVYTAPKPEPTQISRVPHPSRISKGGDFDVARGDGNFSASLIKILSGLDEILAATGKTSVRKEQLAAWTEYSPTSGGYANNLGTLRSAGAIDYPQPGYVAITEEGRKHSQPADTPASTDAMLAHAKRVLSGSEARLLDELHTRYPDSMSKTELAERTGFSPTSGGYANNLGHMRTLGFIDYPEKGTVRAAAWLFLDQKNGEAA